MTPLYDTQEFYKKMLELQDRLRKSEDERMKLEERFNLLSEDSRSRREACINKLRMRYIDYLEEQRLRDERNHQILGALDKIDGSLARMTARTDRLGILRKQYEAYLLRVYANRSAGGGTGDSGVGSHNEDRSPKTNTSQTGKNPPLTQRVVTQSAGNSSSFIPQTHYPQSYVGSSNISQFNVPKYMPGHETPQVHVMQAHGQGDGSTIVQPNRIPQLFHSSQNLHLPNTSVSKAHLMPNASQEFIPSDLTYPQYSSTNNFLRSSHQLDPNIAQGPHDQFHDISNQYPQDTRLYATDPSISRSRILADAQRNLSSDLQSSPGVQLDRANARAVPDFSADFTSEAFGPYRHSTPLPGYLDYSSRYSRDPPVHEPDAGYRYGFTRSDLEKVIHRNEPILPRDYLHNSETVKPPAMSTTKLPSALLEDKQKASDAKPISRGMNDDDLDLYINRIRSLHRDNDQSLEALDIEQNTSGDLLNATLSDDGPEQLTLHSDDKLKLNKNQILSEDVKGVLALADNFVAETENFRDKSQLDNEILSDREISSKSLFSPEIFKENAVAKPAFDNLNNIPPAMLKADMTSGNLSVSATRDDILSRTASVDINKIQDSFPTANGKLRTNIAPPIADIATVSQNNLVEANKVSSSKRVANEESSLPSQEYTKMFENKSNPDVSVCSEERSPTEVPSGRQLMTKAYDFVPKKTEVHEDIEGDKVSLIEGEPMPKQVIDVVKELQPPSLQHYEKNVVEIRVGDEDKKKTNIRTEVPVETNNQDSKDSKLQGNPSAPYVTETSPQDSIASKTHAEYDTTNQKYLGAEEIEEHPLSGSEKQTIQDPQYQDDAEPKYDLNPDHEYPPYEHQQEPNSEPNIVENSGIGQGFEQKSEQLYDPAINDQLHYDTRQTGDESHDLEQPSVPASGEPYDPNQIYDATQHYETDPSQQYAQESNPQFNYDSNQHFEGDLGGQYTESNEQYGAVPNAQYTADPNEQYAAAEPNEQYTSDQTGQYATGSNEHYAADSNEQYVTDSNAQYVTDPNEQYPIDSNEHYAPDPAEQYATDPNEQYTADPNEQYGYYQDQPYENAGDDQYGYGADQGYQHDPNQQYEQDPNQQYEHDPNQQYEHDPNQQYEHDPNESSVQDSNQEYGEQNREQNQNYEPAAGYEESEQDGIQQFDNDAQQNYVDDNPELVVPSNDGYPTSAADEQNIVQAAVGDSHVEELSDPNEVGTKNYSVEGQKKNKDVIRALLESDTESTIERNPSNNTESDFDFN